MPNQKSSSGAKKKFKVTGTGKLRRRTANQSHNLEHKPAKQKRAFSKFRPVAASDAKRVKKLLGRS